MERSEIFYDKVAGFAENLSLTGMVDYLNSCESIKKKNGKPFLVTDTQGYVRRERLPYHMGLLTIVKKEFGNVKLYTITNKRWESNQ